MLQMNPQHSGQGIGRPATFLARFGVAGLDEGDQRPPGHHDIHLREKILPFGLLLAPPARPAKGRGRAVVSS